YSLAIKGRYPGLLATERVELPIALRRDTYEALVKYASGGTITKNRLICPVQDNQVADVNRELSGEACDELRLEIDIPIKRYARGAEAESLCELNLVFLEIELASRAADEILRQGVHGISVIHQALDISRDQAENERFRKLLSWSRLARKGLSDPKIQKALPELKSLLP
ncbi:MAG: hypothetical protein KDD70_18665, partial [Bdellovibrionales bacterium]|nr:hypothetical protein [Bdellovibrionales bacterium]